MACLGQRQQVHEASSEGKDNLRGIFYLANLAKQMVFFNLVHEVLEVKARVPLSGVEGVHQTGVGKSHGAQL
jgi:hypothetical protein